MERIRDRVYHAICSSYPGLFAENQREHLIEGNREKQYMQSLYEDLRKDTTILNSLVRYDSIQTAKLDTTNMLLIENNWTAANIKLLYRLNLKSAGALRYNLSERTAAQLKMRAVCVWLKTKSSAIKFLTTG